jgi:hypothetical protein
VGDDANKSLSPEDCLKFSYFLRIIDQALASLKDRFEQFELYEAIVGFLFNVTFKNVAEEQLMERCTKL